MADPPLIESYRQLGLPVGAPLQDIKTSYRRLARQYHPDMHASNNTADQERFIAIHHAYRYLVQYWEEGSPSATAAVETNSGTAVKVTVKSSNVEPDPPLRPEQQELKVKFQRQWRGFVAEGRFPRAIALLESLARQLPQDQEVQTWQAETYCLWASTLIDQRACEQARTYLKKALRLDPHNRRIWQSVNHQFSRIDQRLSKQ